MSPSAKAEASPMTEVLDLTMSFILSAAISCPEAKAVRPKPRQAPCMTTSLVLRVGLVVF